METNTMGRVTTEATVVNLRDLWLAETGHLPADQVRRLTIPDALADTGATTLSLPTRFVQHLGLTRLQPKRMVTSAGLAEAYLCDAVRLTIQDRQCTVDVMEVPDPAPALIGQVPLEVLDLVVDPRGGRLIPNPAHGGEHIFEMY